MCECLWLGFTCIGQKEMYQSLASPLNTLIGYVPPNNSNSTPPHLHTFTGYVPPYTSNSKYYDLIDGKVVTTSVHPGGSTDRNPVLQHLDQVWGIWVGSPGRFLRYKSCGAHGQPVLRPAASRPGGKYGTDEA